MKNPFLDDFRGRGTVFSLRTCSGKPSYHRGKTYGSPGRSSGWPLPLSPSQENFSVARM